MSNKISTNENISHFDPNQIAGLTFDNARDAVRVHIVDGLKLTAENINIPQFKVPEQKVIEVPVIVKEPEIHQINVPVIVKEIEKVEVPVIVKQVEYLVIEKPIVVTEYKTVEVPVVLKETEFKEMPLFLKICIVMQALGTIGMLITHLILKG